MPAGNTQGPLNPLRALWAILGRFKGHSDPTAYVLSANVHRRHLTKGQQAMATALAYPESEQGKRKTSLLNNEVSGGYIRQARFVLRNCRDKAEEVLRNAKYPLTVAYIVYRKFRQTIYE